MWGKIVAVIIGVAIGMAVLFGVYTLGRHSRDAELSDAKRSAEEYQHAATIAANDLRDVSAKYEDLSRRIDSLGRGVGDAYARAGERSKEAQGITDRSRRVEELAGIVADLAGQLDKILRGSGLFGIPGDNGSTGPAKRDDAIP